MYTAIYRDQNDAVNEIELDAKTERSAKREATSRCITRSSITLMLDDQPIAGRALWTNVRNFGLDRWVDID